MLPWLDSIVTRRCRLLSSNMSVSSEPGLADFFAVIIFTVTAYFFFFNFFDVFCFFLLAYFLSEPKSTLSC